ncbi:MAG: OmpA family protein [Chitinophagaceae bacterium]|nr:OmpA family protein [Chitinophagaceae bacterium]
MEKLENIRKSWEVPLWFAFGTIIIILIIIKGCSADTSAKASEISDATPVTTEQTSVTSIKVRLPDGAELDAYKGGIEDKLVAYLNSTDPADSISKGRWFDFDNLNFKTGSAEITDASMKQVQNLSAILKAYPKVSLKIGGYTDRTGNEQENQKLSQQRADAVQEALKKTGAVSTQLAGAEGYGSQYARAAADAPDEERRADRRISVNVRSK